MSDELSIQGTLAETTVPDLFRSLIRSAESGTVSLEAIGRHDNIYFADGRIIFATSSDPDLGLAEILLRSGEINLQQYTTANDRVVSTKHIGSVLCELGYLKPDELIRAVERQVSTIVMHALSFRTGSYTIDFATDFPRELITLPLQTERLVMDGVNRIDYWSLVARGIGRMDRAVRHSPGSDSRIYHLDLTEEESHIYSLLSETHTVQSLCDRSYLSNFVTCRTLWTLLSVGLVEDAAGGDAAEQRALVETELELEGEVERYNSAFQSIFTVVFQEIGDHVYDFMDRVVRHLSPENMPYLSGINLVNESRVDFDQLLNNLIASGSEDRRAIVENVLTELLYGWILEIRAEFGQRLEPKINRVIEELKRRP